MTEKPASQDHIRSGSDLSLDQHTDVVSAVLAVCIERDDVVCAAPQSVSDACLQCGALSKIDRMTEYGCPGTKRCRTGIVARTIVDYNDVLVESPQADDNVTYDVVLVESRYYDPQKNESTPFTHN